jgi:hypothetical protein
MHGETVKKTHRGSIKLILKLGYSDIFGVPTPFSESLQGLSPEDVNY